jgi:hypothetical protein
MLRTESCVRAYLAEIGCLSTITRKCTSIISTAQISSKYLDQYAPFAVTDSHNVLAWIFQKCLFSLQMFVHGLEGITGRQNTLLLHLFSVYLLYASLMLVRAHLSRKNIPALPYRGGQSLCFSMAWRSNSPGLGV